MNFHPVIASILLLSFSTVQAGSQSDFWLNKMMNAVHQLNYDGYFVYLHGKNIESLRTVHTNRNGHEIERLFSLNGEAREIVRDNDSVTCILPNDKAISTTKRLLNRQSFSGFFKLDPQQITENYQVQFLGKNRVADRSVDVISIAPKDTLRYGYKLHLDDEYALPLQWDMFDQDNRLVSSLMFTQISIGNDVEDSGSLLGKELPSLSSSKVITPKPGKKIDLDWAFNDIPKGFKIKHQSSGLPRLKSREIDHFLFSDGLASFSVYIEQTDKIRLNGPARLGALNAFGVFIDGFQVTAFGEVPSETLLFVKQLKKEND